MLILNADDWGGSRAETDAACECFREGRITSTSAMVFMPDSERAAELAREQGFDVGLHLNLSQPFGNGRQSSAVAEAQQRIVRFLTRSKYALLFYNPFLREQFMSVCLAQLDEFERLYGKPPSHLDGHQHMHLCSNLLVDRILPKGRKVRRSFSFRPGEKSVFNRAYRRLVDWRLSRRYQLTDYFFALSSSLRDGGLGRVMELARTSVVEVMTHPIQPEERRFLLGTEFPEMVKGVEIGSFSSCANGAAPALANRVGTRSTGSHSRVGI